jgi:quinol monooxygenase YgiN
MYLIATVGRRDACAMVCLAWLSLLLFAKVDATRAQDANGAAYVVSYIDVSKPGVTRVADILRQMVQGSRQASGAARYDVLQRLAPQNQFVIVEVWKNQQARIENLGQPQVKALRAELKPFLLAPIDERLYAIIVASERSPATADAVYAVAHIDILGPNPAGRDAFLPTLKAFSDASRRAAGNLGYDLVEQSSRTNHFEAVEVWANDKSAIDYEISALNRDFRAKLTPVSSSPYDRRLFKALR